MPLLVKTVILLLLTHLTPAFSRSIFPRDTTPDPTTLTVTDFGPSGSNTLEPLEQYPGSFSFTIQDQQSTVPNATCSWPGHHTVGDTRTPPVPLNVNQPCNPRTYQYLVQVYDGPDSIQMVVSHTVETGSGLSNVTHQAGTWIQSCLLPPLTTVGRDMTTYEYYCITEAQRTAPGGWLGDAIDYGSNARR